MAKGISALKRECKNLNIEHITKQKILNYIFFKNGNKRSPSITCNIRGLFNRIDQQSCDFLNKLGVNCHLYKFFGVVGKTNKVDVILRDGVYYVIIYLMYETQINDVYYSKFCKLFDVQYNKIDETISIKLGKRPEKYIKPTKKYCITNGDITEIGNQVIVDSFKKQAKSFFNKTLSLYDEKIKEISIKNKNNANEIESLQSKIKALQLDIQINEDKIKEMVELKSNKLTELVNELLK